MEFAYAGGLLVDVGANYGYYSLLWVEVGKHRNRTRYFRSKPLGIIPKPCLITFPQTILKIRSKCKTKLLENPVVR